MIHSRLSEIDLARALIVPAGSALEAEMRHYNAGFGLWSYNPARCSTCDILGARTALFGTMPRTPWEKIAPQIMKACKRGPDQIKANLQVGKALFDSSCVRKWSAVNEPMSSLSIGFGESVRYWCDVVLQDENGPFIPFIDHRRSSGLANPELRRVVFSMQHIGLRERYPDLVDARLAVIRSRWMEMTERSQSTSTARNVSTTLIQLSA